ncbi:hypothetical protein [Azoarcus sp. DN11]|uniref:hypothetical protein n=1 Tax=Azoarcus sp. DN11 TaxID=356837 RepID=UPI000EAF5FF1|nr:hypothetical protein [Azoarcus sp. DN11]AYH46125.1 hypothetical protein CDA09_22565 [Azoarcus sp. DN11]
MNNWIKKGIVSVAAVCFAGVAAAQFGGLANALPGGSKSAGGVTAESLVKSYVSGTKYVLASDAKLLSALGLKDQAAKSELQANNLTEGATVGSLEDAVKVQTESSKQLAEGFDNSKVALDAEGKKAFTLGLVDLAKGITSYSNMSSDVSKFTPSATSIGGAAGAAMFVVKTLPDTSTNLMNTLKKAVAFAKENKIEVPKEATSLL